MLYFSDFPFEFRVIFPLKYGSSMPYFPIVFGIQEKNC